jgi:transglutaminase-like putative cysteine protease
MHRLNVCFLLQAALALISVLGVISASSRACTITITSEYTCDANADKFNPMIGDADYIRVNWTIDGTPKAPYSVQFTVANQTDTFTGYPASAGKWWTYYGGFTLPLVGPIPYTVTIDSTGVTGNKTPSKATFSGTFTPIAPTKAIQYFDPETYFGSETFTVDWLDGSGDVTSGFTLLGCPATGSFQTVNELYPPIGAKKVITSPSKDPVWQTTIPAFSPVAGFDTTTTTDYFNVTENNIRCNPDLLALATWADIAALPAATYGPDLASDSLTQSTDPSITAYVATILPSDYKTTMTPYAVAEAVFLAEVKDITYVRSPPSIDAVSTLARRTGDCGSMSDLYDACLRAIGIPARMDCGFWQGNNQLHCFSEFYLPNCGWVPADTSQDAENWDPTGTYPYMFAADTYRDTFCAVSRGTVHSGTGFDISEIQVGWFFYFGSAATSSLSDTSSLAPVD